MRAERNTPSKVPRSGWVPAAVEAPKSALAPYVEAVRAHAVLVGLIVGVVFATAMVWLVFRPPEYRAEAEILATPLPIETVALVGVPLLQDLREPTRTIQTAAALVDSHAAAARTAQALGSGWSRRRVEQAVDVEPKGETNILDIIAVADTPQLAADLANTYATETLAVRRETLQRLAGQAIPGVRARLRQLSPTDPGVAELQSALSWLTRLARGQDPTLSLAQSATAPSSALGPPTWLVAILALLAGGILGVATALVVERVTPARITSEEELVTTYPLPILARVPTLPRHRRDELTLDIEPATREVLRTVQVQLDLAGGRPRTVMITSPSPDDGKTTTALAFCVALADSGTRVILIDSDVRRMPIRAGLEGRREPVPPVPAGAGRPAAARVRRDGAAVTQEGRAPSLRPLLRRVQGHPNLQLLDAMDVGFDSADVHSRTRFTDLVRAAANEADYVVLDTPPIGVVSDALTLLEFVDDVILVAKTRWTKRIHVEVTRDLFARAGVDPAGYIVIGERPVGTYPYFTSQAASR
jgi:Mrp family chromosome partitioning ATPase